MTEEELNKLPNNDNLAQWCRSLINSNNKQYIKERKDEILNCNHLFLKLKDKEYIGSLHSSDCYDEPAIVECVHCGLTNKFKYLEEKFEESKTTIESIMFDETFKNGYRRSGKSFNDSIFNVISDNVIKTNQAKLLYKLAIIINPQGTNEELFDIMTKLNELETNLEKWKLSKVEQCEDLLDRYKERKTLIKK